MQFHFYLEIKLFVICQNIVLERIKNYYKKDIEMYTKKKKKISIKPLFVQSKNMTGNSSSIYLKLKKMQYTTLCRVGTRRRRPLYL